MFLMPFVHIFLVTVPLWVLIVLPLLPLIFGVIVYVKYGFKLFLVKKCNEEEIWLPVVDDAGNIIGRVAKCVSQEEPGKYQHPLVRILVWHEGKLYLRPRSDNVVFEPGMMDHPFEQLIYFGHNIDETLLDIRNRFFPDAEKPRFLLKYKHENKEGKWLVLLYLVTVADKEQLKNIQHKDGKLWPLTQINENSGMLFFSRIFEGEIDFFRTLLSK